MTFAGSYVDRLIAQLAANMTPEEQAAEASHIANQYFQATGVPLIVGPNQMKAFREAGVDCTHLLEVGEIGGL